jgi:hypothetical protein
MKTGISLGLTLCVLGIGCEGAELSPPMQSGTLVVDSAHAETGLVAHMPVADGVLRIRSQVVGAARITAVSRGDAVLAMWNTEVATDDVQGSFGGKTFGNDPDQDENTALWGSVASSDVGVDLRALALAAKPLADDPQYQAAAGGLKDVATMAGYLEEMAGNIPYAETSCYTYNQYAWTNGYGQYDVEGATCRRNNYACTGSYCVQEYHKKSDGTLVALYGARCAYLTPLTCLTETYNVCRGSGNSYTLASKHWRSGGPAHWITRNYSTHSLWSGHCNQLL